VRYVEHRRWPVKWFCWLQDEVVCIQCKDGLQPSPYGDRCDPTDYTTPEWFIPVIVVNAVILAVLIFGVIALVIYRRSSASTRQPRPPLPRPEELDDLPSSRNSKKHRRSTVKRERYTPTPSNSNQLPPQQVTILLSQQGWWHNRLLLRNALQLHL